MNRLVRAWERHRQRAVYDGPDGLTIDGERFVFEKGKREMDEKSKLRVNEHGVVKLALYGLQDRKESLFYQTRRTIRRLRINVGKAKAFDEPPAGEGAEPNLHDVIAWLNGIDGTAKYTHDRRFLRRLHKTLLGRVRPEVCDSKQV